jgi:uncharacterized protein YicC (UPF0701 family)
LDNDEIKYLLDKIFNKLDKLDDRIDHIDKTLAENTIIVREHERRSLAAEQNLQLLKMDMHNEISPIKTHVQNIQGIGKLVKWLSIVSSAIIAVLGINKYL